MPSQALSLRRPTFAIRARRKQQLNRCHISTTSHCSRCVRRLSTIKLAVCGMQSNMRMSAVNALKMHAKYLETHDMAGGNAAAAAARILPQAANTCTTTTKQLQNAAGTQELYCRSAAACICTATHCRRSINKDAQTRANITPCPWLPSVAVKSSLFTPAAAAAALNLTA